jgi:hypothetical protein
LEVDEAMIHRWLRVTENRKEIAALRGGDYLDNIQRETPEYVGRLTQLSERVFGEFINLFGVKKKFFSPPLR